MTDTLNKNPESGTGYRTPETGEAKFWSDHHGHYVVFADRAGDFEHERDVDRSIVDTQKEHISLLKKQREEAEAIARQCERVSNIYEQRMLEAEAANLKLERERDAYENALIKIEQIAYSDNDVYHDIEQIEATAHNALNRH